MEEEKDVWNIKCEYAIDNIYNNDISYIEFDYNSEEDMIVGLEIIKKQIRNGIFYEEEPGNLVNMSSIFEIHYGKKKE